MSTEIERCLPEGKAKSNMEIDLNKLEARDAHDLLASAIIPRPIAGVSSVNAQGHINLGKIAYSRQRTVYRNIYPIHFEI